jgi:hypothetical protein
MSKLPWKGKGNDENDSEHDDQTATIDPRQWSDRVRRGATITMGLFAFLEPFASSMIAPSLPIIAEDFGITSSVERNVSARTIKPVASLELTANFGSSFFHLSSYLTHSGLSYSRLSRRALDANQL